MTDASAQLGDFQRDGFIAIQQLFDRKKIQEINAELNRFIEKVVPSMPSEQVYYEDTSDKHSLKQIQRIFEHDVYFNELMTQSIIKDIAQNVLQDTVRPINMQYFNKPPGVNQATPAHQDGYYFHLKPCEAVTGWLALDAVDEENGCVRYVTGSHASESFRPHGSSGVIGFSQGITDFGTEEDHANTLTFPGDAGLFLMHHAKTIHFASANQSPTRSRRALGFIYYASRAEEDIEARNRYQDNLDTELKSAGKI